MKHLKSITFAAIAGATLFAATAGAASSSSPVAGQSNLTPVASSTPAVGQSIKAQKLNSNIQVNDWLSDSKLLYSKPNLDISSVNPVSNKKYHPSNIYVRDIATGKDTLLAPNKTTVGGIVVSPDQKYVFFIDDNGFNIMNVSTAKSVNIANVTFKNANYASWSDNTHFIYSTNEGNIISVDVNGKSQTLLKTGQKRLGGDITVVGSTIYYAYTNADSSVTFMSYNMQTKESTTLKNENSILRSSNGSQGAMIKDSSLVLTDAKGNVKTTIAKGVQEGYLSMAWSPDGSKLAYKILNPSTYTATNYIYDVKTGKQSPVSIDKAYLSNIIKWSPSGQKVFFYSSNKDFTTFIASLS